MKTLTSGWGLAVGNLTAKSKRAGKPCTLLEGADVNYLVKVIGQHIEMVRLYPASQAGKDVVIPLTKHEAQQTADALTAIINSWGDYGGAAAELVDMERLLRQSAGRQGKAPSSIINKRISKRLAYLVGVHLLNELPFVQNSTLESAVIKLLVAGTGQRGKRRVESDFPYPSTLARRNVSDKRAAEVGNIAELMVLLPSLRPDAIRGFVKRRRSKFSE